MNIRMFSTAVICWLSAIALAEPEVTALTVTQNDSHLVTIDYTLSEDAIVTIDMKTNSVSIGSENFRTLFDATESNGGYPVNKVVKGGRHTIMWKPNREWPGYVFKNGEFAVELKAWALSNPPDYMVVDLAVPSNLTFYASAADLPDGGLKTADPGDAEAVNELTNDVYRTSKLVMRRVPAAGNQWRMGSPTTESAYRDVTEVTHYVTLTEDYYLSIYPLTWRQRYLIDGLDNTSATIPACYTSYESWRGSATGADYCWPGNLHAVSEDSKMQKVRSRTGLEFDFPTEAQWEYACRSGTSGMFADDSADGLAIGWYLENTVPAGSVQPVGLKKANSWGFFDMHGNCLEWVLDQWGTHPTDAQIDPRGPTNNPGRRVLKGGSVCWNNIVKCRSAGRVGFDPAVTSDNLMGGGLGVRLCCPATIPAMSK